MIWRKEYVRDYLNDIFLGYICHCINGEDTEHSYSQKYLSVDLY